MGYYYAHHLLIPLKEDTPKHILSFFNTLYSGLSNFYDETGIVPKKNFLEDNQFIIDFNKVYPNIRTSETICVLTSLIYGASEYHSAWRIQQIQDNRKFTSFSSTTRFGSGSELLKCLFTAILPYLDIDDGDIVHRFIGEDMSVEHIHWVDKVNNCIVENTGYKYSQDQGYCTDSDAPQYSEQGKEIFIPEMNWYKLETELTSQRNKHDTY